MITAANLERLRKHAPSIRSTGALMLLMTLTGCPQQTYHVGISLKNHCDHSVRATTTHASNFSSYDRSSVIGPSQSEWVAHYISFNSDVRAALRDGYTLTLDGEGGSQTLGRSEMLVMLDHAKLEKDGSHFSTYEISYEPLCNLPAR